MNNTLLMELVSRIGCGIAMGGAETYRVEESVNRILGSFAHIIRGRMGIPDQESGEAVIGLIVKGGNDELGALTGKLGNLLGVQVKSALTASKK